jgi:uncharacterized membrane protein YoaK (UPF0700 family)
MLKKYSHTRSLSDNIKLGVLTAFSAGMVNVSSWVLFFAFTSNITGHYAILAEEIASGKWFQVVVVLIWILLYMGGSFLSNFIIIHGRHKYSYFSHAAPLILEFICLFAVGFYGTYYYEETLLETEYLVATLLLAMGLQNGLTASISNFAVKTTHLTGLTTDLGIHISLLTKRQHRNNPEIWNKLKLLSSIMFSYVMGAVLAGLLVLTYEFQVFFYVCGTIVFIIFYDLWKVYLLLGYFKIKRGQHRRRLENNND